MSYQCYHYIIQICSGITPGRVLNGELYALRLQKLIYLHLSADCFMKQSVKCRCINFCNLCVLLYHVTKR